MKIIDVHTHMDYITQNFQTDVVGCVCCAVKESEWKKIVELVLVYLLGVVFVLTIALRVNEIERESISNTSVASNYSVTISNYE